MDRYPGRSLPIVQQGSVNSKMWGAQGTSRILRLSAIDCMHACSKPYYRLCIPPNNVVHCSIGLL